MPDQGESLVREEADWFVTTQWSVVRSAFVESGQPGRDLQVTLALLD